MVLFSRINLFSYSSIVKVGGGTDESLNGKGVLDYSSVAHAISSRPCSTRCYSS